jgi:hypothetical protein
MYIGMAGVLSRARLAIRHPAEKLGEMDCVEITLLARPFVTPADAGAQGISRQRLASPAIHAYCQQSAGSTRAS